MKHAEHKRSTFSGKIGFVLSAAGASVGLGNIWRFPYLAAKYGGNARFAAGCVTVSTLLSLLAIPAWCLVLQMA